MNIADLMIGCLIPGAAICIFASQWKKKGSCSGCPGCSQSSTSLTAFERYRADQQKSCKDSCCCNDSSRNN